MAQGMAFTRICRIISILRLPYNIILISEVFIVSDNWLMKLFCISYRLLKAISAITKLSFRFKTEKLSSWAEPKTQNLQMFELSRASHAREDWLESVQLNYLCSVKQWVEKIQAENTFLSKFLYTIINIPWLPGCVLKVVWWSHKLPCDFHLESGWVGL